MSWLRVRFHVFVDPSAISPLVCLLLSPCAGQLFVFPSVCWSISACQFHCVLAQLTNSQISFTCCLHSHSFRGSNFGAKGARVYVGGSLCLQVDWISHGTLFTHFIRCIIYLFIYLYLFIYWYIDLLIDWFIYLFIYWFIYWKFDLLIYGIYWFINLFIDPFPFAGYVRCKLPSGTGSERTVLIVQKVSNSAKLPELPQIPCSPRIWAQFCYLIPIQTKPEEITMLLACVFLPSNFFVHGLQVLGIFSLSSCVCSPEWWIVSWQRFDFLSIMRTWNLWEGTFVPEVCNW